MPSLFLLYHLVRSIRFYSRVKLSLLPISLNPFRVLFSIVSQMLYAYLVSFSQANHLLGRDRILQNLRFVFCFFLWCEQNRISQSIERGLTVMKCLSSMSFSILVCTDILKVQDEDVGDGQCQRSF